MVKAGSPRDTPMMQQYRRIKEEYPDVFLFYRMGDFYELFEQDAVEASQLLNITLTSRSKGPDAVPMAGVPAHSVDDYMKKIIQLGKRVAICEQLEDPSQTKKLVERGVVRVVTPGTLTENFLSDQASHLLSVFIDRDHIFLAWCDLSTGEVGLGDSPAKSLTESLVGLNLQEVLMPAGEEIPVEFENSLTRPAWQFKAEEGLKVFKEVYRDAVPENWSQGLWAALGGLLHYLIETQKEKITHLKSPVIRDADRFVHLDTSTIQSLDLLENSRTRDKEYSLYWVLCRCQTAAGRRLLQKWITHPLAKSREIYERQLAFKDLQEAPEGKEQIRKILSQVLDIERLLGRLSLNRGSPRDLQALGRSLAALDLIEQVFSDSWQAELLAQLKVRLQPLTDLVNDIEKHLVDDLPLNLSEGGVIAEGVDDTLDELKQSRSEAHRWIAEYQAREIESTGLNNLRVNHNRVFGYTIELPRRDAEKVPDHFKRQQTLKNAERYITAELKDFETKVLSAREKSIAQEKKIYQELIQRTLRFLKDIQSRSEALAELDVLIALSELSDQGGWVLPTLSEGRLLEIIEGRHPVVEKTLDAGQFIPNDLILDENQSLMLLTGPNMAGKSTYIRQVALLTLMAQMGMPVPVKSMCWSPVDRIHTRIGAADELAKGQSTFMVEMAECASILKSSSKDSLIIFDEVGRGTSTLDGLAIARAIIEYLAGPLPARTLFATHYHELTGLAQNFPLIKNANVLVKEWGEEIIFLHQVVQGATDRSYGIHVARLAGIPETILKRAADLLQELKPEDMWDLASPGGEKQLDLFSSAPSAVENKLKSLTIENLTPLEALNTLAELKKEVDS